MSLITFLSMGIVFYPQKKIKGGKTWMKFVEVQLVVLGKQEMHFNNSTIPHNVFQYVPESVQRASFMRVLRVGQNG